MNQRGLYLLCCAVLVCITSHDQATAQGTTLQPSANSAIQVYLTATGKNAATAIQAQLELTASIDKQPAQVTSLRSAKDEKLLFALLIDRSKLQAPNAESIKKAATLLFQSLTTGGNQGYLVIFDEGIFMSKRPLLPSEAREVIDEVKFDGGTALYEAIGKTSTQLLSRSRNPDFPRRAIILISDGDDNISNLTFAKADEIAITEGVTIFSLVTPNNERHGKFAINLLSITTGGRAIVDKHMEEGVAPLLAAINGQWALSLVPQQAPDQKLHLLTVKTTQRGVSLIAPEKILLR